MSPHPDYFSVDFSLASRNILLCSHNTIKVGKLTLDAQLPARLRDFASFFRGVLGAFLQKDPVQTAGRTSLAQLFTLTLVETFSFHNLLHFWGTQESGRCSSLWIGWLLLGLCSCGRKHTAGCWVFFASC